MKLIFCIDDKSGMMFFGKRQSQDQNLREWILNYAQGSKLWMSLYSAKQFGNNASVLDDDDYMGKAEEMMFALLRMVRIRPITRMKSCYANGIDTILRISSLIPT